MAINFPSSPVLNDTYTFGDTTWKWNGSAWDSVSSSVAASSLDELSDVDLSAIITDKEVLAYDGATSVWVNKHPLSLGFLDSATPNQPILYKFIGNNAFLGGNTENIVSSTTTSGTYSLDLKENALWGTIGSIHYFTSNQTGNRTINVRGDSSTTLASLVGNTYKKSTTVVVLLTNGATPYYISTVQVDGVAQTVKWLGGAAPTAGNANSVDVYTFSIFRLNSSWTVFGSVAKFA